MIEIKRMQVEPIEGFFKKRITFDLKFPKHIGLSSDKLILEYTIDDVRAIGDIAILSLLPVAYWENVDICLDKEIVFSN